MMNDNSRENDQDSTESSNDSVAPADAESATEPSPAAELIEADLVFLDEDVKATANSGETADLTLGPNELTVGSVNEIPQAEVVEAIVINEETVMEAMPDPRLPPAIREQDAQLTSEDKGAAPAVAGERKPPLSWQLKPQSALARESISSVGGAVASVFLGILALAGSFLTVFSAINTVLGFGLGIWGLTSPRKRMAVTGITLCVIGFVVPLVLGSLDLREMWKSNQEVDPLDESIMRVDE